MAQVYGLGHFRGRREKILGVVSGRFELAEHENELELQLIRAERHPIARATTAQLLENYYFPRFPMEIHCNPSNPWKSWFWRKSMDFTKTNIFIKLYICAKLNILVKLRFGWVGGWGI